MNLQLTPMFLYRETKAGREQGMILRFILKPWREFSERRRTLLTEVKNTLLLQSHTAKPHPKGGEEFH